MLQRDENFGPEVVLTRVAAGPSPRLVALALSAVLAAVVVIGVSARHSPAPTRSPAKLTLMTALGRDKFAVTATIARRPFLGLLEEVSPGKLSGTYRIPVLLTETATRFELAQLWTTDGPENYVPIAAWDLPLSHLSRMAHELEVLLDVNMDGKPNDLQSPRPIKLGYSLVIRGEGAPTSDTLTFELEMPTR